jgi:hypothetical protein
MCSRYRREHSKGESFFTSDFHGRTGFFGSIWKFDNHDFAEVTRRSGIREP